MGFKKDFFKNVAVFGGYSYLTWIFDTLISTVILSRFLKPEEYGFVALINIFSGFILMFSNTGLTHAIIRSEYGYTFQKLVFNISVWVGVFLGLVLCMLAYPITLIYDKPDLFWPTIVISLQFFTNALNIVPMAILQKRLEFKFIGLMNFVVVVVTISTMIVLAISGFSYWSLIIPLVLQPIYRQIFLRIKVKFGIHLYGWKMTVLGFKKVRTLLQSISVFNVINYFARNADNFAIGKFYGEASLGLYDRAYKFLYMARRLINTTLGPVLFPSLRSEISKGHDYRKHFLDILGIVNFVNILIAAPLILFAKPITLVLWGKDWLGVADYLSYIGAIIPLQTLLIAAEDLYMLEKKERAYLVLGVPSSLILVVGITVGAFFSAIHIIRFYALSFLLVQIPVDLYFGHYRILKFKAGDLLKFWGPKVILSIGIVFSIWFGNSYISGALLLLFMTDVILKQGKDILQTISLVYDKSATLLKKRKGK